MLPLPPPPSLFVALSVDTSLICRFDENYNLASTQSLKNKDIPEGGAKGTILPSLVFFFTFSNSYTNTKFRLGASPRKCFEKYVDVCISILWLFLSFYS
jgi:NAD-specific glutamate dehydrogenase